MDYPNSEFWNYSTQIWTLPGIEPVCLEFQNNYDANVNILLYCCWVGDKKLSINDDDVQVLLDTAQPWQTIIKPLRDSRKMMQQNLMAMPSEMIEQTTSNICEMELNAEHMEQLALEKALNLSQVTPCTDTSNIECSLNNLNRYLQSIESITSVNVLSQQITQLLNAAYQDEQAVQVSMMNSAAFS